MITPDEVRKLLEPEARAEPFERHIDERIRAHALCGFPGSLTVKLATIDLETLKVIERRYIAAGWLVGSRFGVAPYAVPPEITISRPK